MAWPAPLSLGFGVVALMIATLYAQFGIPGALFLFMPLTALRVVREAKMRLDDALAHTLMDFANAVDEKDPFTYRHSERVATIAIELHRELGTRPRDLEKRWYAAILHDIGKVAVPNAILSKPSALTHQEFAVIKEHPSLGAAVVSRVDLLRGLAEEVRHHHERVDGSGYPDGLAGADIPFAARALAVADAYEALTSDRPYRRALLAHDALSRLVASAGSHHDPEIVDALGRVLARGVTFVRPGADRAHEYVAPRDTASSA
jgi:putative nucleotidyltransferase with HDIG domain